MPRLPSPSALDRGAISGRPREPPSASGWRRACARRQTRARHAAGSIVPRGWPSARSPRTRTHEPPAPGPSATPDAFSLDWRAHPRPSMRADRSPYTASRPSADVPPRAVAGSHEPGDGRWPEARWEMAAPRASVRRDPDRARRRADPSKGRGGVISSTCAIEPGSCRSCSVPDAPRPGRSAHALGVGPQRRTSSRYVQVATGTANAARARHA